MKNVIMLQNKLLFYRIPKQNKFASLFIAVWVKLNKLG